MEVLSACSTVIRKGLCLWSACPKTTFRSSNLPFYTLNLTCIYRPNVLHPFIRHASDEVLYNASLTLEKLRFTTSNIIPVSLHKPGFVLWQHGCCWRRVERSFAWGCFITHFSAHRPPQIQTASCILPLRHAKFFIAQNSKIAVLLKGNASFNGLEHFCRKQSRKRLRGRVRLVLGFISVEVLAPGVSAGRCQLLINMPKEQVLYNLRESKHLTCTPKVTRYAYIFDWLTSGISVPPASQSHNRWC